MQKGEFVRISYIGRVNGEIFDLTDEDVAKREKIFNPRIKYKPVPVIVGAGFVIPGLDEELEKMKVGEKKKVTIPAEKAFGQRKKELVKVVPESAFKKQNFKPKAGLIVDFSGTKGRIQSVSAGRVRVDFNHPLAGKDLEYEIEIKEKITDKKEQVNAVLDFFGFPIMGVSIDKNVVNIDVDTQKGFPRPELKARVAGIILKYVDGMKKVMFTESFVKGGSKEKLG